MDLRDYRIGGKPIKDMSDDELREHFTRLRGSRVSEDTPTRKTRATKANVLAPPIEAEEI